MARDEAVSCYLTVCFEEPFWVGMYERVSGRRYEVCRIVFGAESSNAEVCGFLLQNAYRLAFSSTVEADRSVPRAMNPRRRQREARRQMQSAALGTKAQQTLKMQREQAKDDRKTRRQEHREADEQRCTNCARRSGARSTGATEKRKNIKNAGWALSSCILHITIDVAKGGCAAFRVTFGPANDVETRGNGISAHRKGETNYVLRPASS